MVDTSNSIYEYVSQIQTDKITKKYHLFNEWQLNYDEFVKNFPNSEFITHLQDMKIGIYNIVGNHDRFIMDIQILSKSIDKV